MDKDYMPDKLCCNFKYGIFYQNSEANT